MRSNQTTGYSSGVMQVIENDIVRFKIENDILYSELKYPVILGVEEASEIIELRHKISNQKSQYWCMDYRNLKSASKEVQDYIDKHGQDYVEACAVLVNSFLSKFLIEVFITYKNPKVPMKIFTSQGPAVEWLLKMKKTKIHLNRCRN